MIVGFDWGNWSIGMATAQNVVSYPSDLVPYDTIRVKNELRKHDFMFEFQGRKGFGGQLARDERSSLDVMRKGDSKLHQDALIRLLLGLSTLPSKSFKVVVGQPIGRHNDEHEFIKDMIIGEHDITINDKKQTISITDALVGVEGGSAWFSQPMPGECHFIDIGSGTINMATMKNGRFINSKSDTIPRGMENLGASVGMVAKAVENKMIDMEWGQNVWLLGGGANQLGDYLAFKLLKPSHLGREWGCDTANAIGFYKIGELAWQKS